MQSENSGQSFPDRAAGNRSKITSYVKLAGVACSMGQLWFEARAGNLSNGSPSWCTHAGACVVLVS